MLHFHFFPVMFSSSAAFSHHIQNHFSLRRLMDWRTQALEHFTKGQGGVAGRNPQGMLAEADETVMLMTAPVSVLGVQSTIWPSHSTPAIMFARERREESSEMKYRMKETDVHKYIHIYTSVTHLVRHVILLGNSDDFCLLPSFSCSLTIFHASFSEKQKFLLYNWRT